MTNNPPPQSHIEELDKMYEHVEPLVAKMRAKYPSLLNIDGLEPALTADVAEIALIIKKEAESHAYRRVLDFIDRKYLSYCREANGRPYCKNCGLDKEDLQDLMKT